MVFRNVAKCPFTSVGTADMYSSTVWNFFIEASPSVAGNSLPRSPGARPHQ
jgi:hypothetical protein